MERSRTRERPRRRRVLLLLAAAALSVVLLWPAGSARTGTAPVKIPAGTDTFPSGATVTFTVSITDPPTTETVELSSAGLPDAVVRRGEPALGSDGATTIPTEIVSMELRGTSPKLGPVVIQVGRERNPNLRPSQGEIRNVQVDRDGNFVSGDSFFDVWFSLSVLNLDLHAQSDQPLRVEATITSLPPNKPVPLPTKPVEHFKCYQVKTKGPLPSRTVALDDQFEVERAKVLRPLTLCAPVSKDKEQVRQPLVHLKCYAIQDTSRTRKPQGRNVLVHNQFGKQSWKVLDPKALCVPSLKKVLAKPTVRPVFPKQAPERLLDHYKCYGVEPKEPFQARAVTLDDQFETERAKVLKPSALCAPVKKDKGAVREPAAHLACYEIQDESRKPKPGSRTVAVKNQLGTETLTVLGPKTLCVPSRKTPPCSEYAERSVVPLIVNGQQIGVLNEARHIPFLKAAGSPCE